MLFHIKKEDYLSRADQKYIAYYAQRYLPWNSDDFKLADRKKPGEYDRPEIPVNTPFVHVERVPPGILGEGVLGRCFLGDGRIQIRWDLFGDESEEVYAHEVMHRENRGLSESEVRRITRMKLSHEPYYH